MDSKDLNISPKYCHSRYTTVRRMTRVVNVGDVAIGGEHPIRIQSMTTTNTQDVKATVAQTLALADAGCEIVRITAPNKAAAAALEDIHKQVRAAQCSVPLVADIHFLPSAAMEAVKHVEKVRINPGNYADKKKFQVKEYTDRAYQEELERLDESFTPFVLKCKEYGRAMRIGTNHGSLSDRIMNRYGDTPMGMVESAMEFLRIAERHSFHDICLSMKASNPKVMIQAYRLVVAAMDAEGMQYPLHLGVTEAGDGEDARVKSSIGIGSLLADGLGDTIRVSLTEDPIHEIPVARQLAEKAKDLWKVSSTAKDAEKTDSIDPYTFTRRDVDLFDCGHSFQLGGDELPKVLVAVDIKGNDPHDVVRQVCSTQMKLKDKQLEGIVLRIENSADLDTFDLLYASLQTALECFVLDLHESIDLSEIEAHSWPTTQLSAIVLNQRFGAEDGDYLQQFHLFCKRNKFVLSVDCDAIDFGNYLGSKIKKVAESQFILTSSAESASRHAIGVYRGLAEAAKNLDVCPPLWIRNTKANSMAERGYYSDTLIENSILSGSLLCDGVGDLISIEMEDDVHRATTLGYNILQAARARITKTEFVACPSCGRTLFDLQSVTQKIRSKTDHLKGVTIAIMGCIVNGPGEMADADFGYVGGAPGKINLYVGKECVKYNVPSDEALDRLIDLIKEKGRWVEPATN